MNKHLDDCRLDDCFIAQGGGEWGKEMETCLENNSAALYRCDVHRGSRLIIDGFFLYVISHKDNVHGIAAWCAVLSSCRQMRLW